MADNQLIRNANVNAQTAIETAQKAMDCAKELAPVQGEHAATLSIHGGLIESHGATISALANGLVEAQFQIIEMREVLGLPLTEYQQGLKAIKAHQDLQERIARAAQKSVSDIPVEETAQDARQPLLVLQSDEGAEDPQDLTSGE